MIKSIVSVTFATILMGSLAFGQASSTTTAVTSDRKGNTETTTTTTESTGVVTEFTPGQTLMLKTEAATPVRYKFGKSVTYVTSDGRVIESSKIKKDSKVQLHYVKQGDDMLVEKVIVTDVRD